jgi:hypothetical protein
LNFSSLKNFLGPFWHLTGCIFNNFCALVLQIKVLLQNGTIHSVGKGSFSEKKEDVVKGISGYP